MSGWLVGGRDTLQGKMIRNPNIPSVQRAAVPCEDGSEAYLANSDESCRMNWYNPLDT
jgi:hypothetical protein